jgi:hypothetical protein
MDSRFITLNAGQSYLFESNMGSLGDIWSTIVNTSAKIDRPDGCGDDEPSAAIVSYRE